MRITDVEALTSPPSGPRRGSWLQEEVVVGPMSVYPKYKAQRWTWSGHVAHVPVVVRIRTDTGLVGYGRGAGGLPSCYIVEHHFKQFLLDSDPADIELLWDQMYRASMTYGTRGLAIQALSAVDNALWDLLGKAHGVPVFKLLGGRTKDRVPVYATGRRSELYARMGFHGNKISQAYGPADGLAGMQENERLVARARDAMGRDRFVAVDAWMSWDVEYTLQMAERLKPYDIRWIEEPLPPTEVAGMAFLRERIKPVQLSTGEHEYTHFGFADLFDRRALDIVSLDVQWCGGITAARKICAMAAAHGIPVIPHTCSVFGYHLSMSQPNSPLHEFGMFSGDGSEITPKLGEFTGEPLPQDGYVDLPDDRPGFGIELREDAHLVRPCPAAPEELP